LKAVKARFLERRILLNVFCRFLSPLLQAAYRAGFEVPPYALQVDSPAKTENFRGFMTSLFMFKLSFRPFLPIVFASRLGKFISVLKKRVYVALRPPRDKVRGGIALPCDSLLYPFFLQEGDEFPSLAERQANPSEGKGAEQKAS